MHSDNTVRPSGRPTVRQKTRPGGLEPPAFWSVAKRSIQLSYGRFLSFDTGSVEGEMAASVLPLLPPLPSCTSATLLLCVKMGGTRFELVASTMST